MINDNSTRTVEASTWRRAFRKPCYDSYSFSRLPATIAGLLGAPIDRLPPAWHAPLPADCTAPLGSTYDRVITLFIDAFGFRFFELFSEKLPFLQRFQKSGVVNRLTSQFPSTTAAHVTTIHTGVPVGESGVYEWFYYEPIVDGIIAPLLFSMQADPLRNTLDKGKFPADAIFPFESLYGALAGHGIESHLFQYHAYLNSPFSDVTCKGAIQHPYQNAESGLADLVETVRTVKGPAYFHLYFDSIDSKAHTHGPLSPEFNAVAEQWFDLLEKSFFGPGAAMPDRTLLMIIADHGQVRVEPKDIVEVNVVEPRLEEWIMRTRSGEPIAPAGSKRDLFLHIRPEHLADAKSALETKLGGMAEIVESRTLIAEGFFGPSVSERFLERVGNLVVLPHETSGVWWRKPKLPSPPHLGFHGGLSPTEMDVPLLLFAF